MFQLNGCFRRSVAALSRDGFSSLDSAFGEIMNLPSDELRQKCMEQLALRATLN